MEEEKKVSETKTDDEGKDPAHEQPERTDKEKAEYNLKRALEKAREHGVDPMEIVGTKPLKVEDNLPDDTPLTVGSLREMQKQEAKRTALQLADELPEDEREEVKTVLKDRIIPSMNPHADLELARAAVGAKRTAQLAEEQARKIQAQRTASGGSSPANMSEEFKPTEEELKLFSGFGLSTEKLKEKIIEARQRAEAKR